MEYLIAFLLFSLVILYVSFQAAGVIPEVVADRGRSRKDSEAHRIVTFLAEADAIFADEPYLWDEDRMDEFQERCQENYSEVREDFGLEELSGVRIVKFERGTKDEYYVCEPPFFPEGVAVGSASRFGYVEGDDIYRLEVTVW